MGDAFVAVDAGFAGLLRRHMALIGARLLEVTAHRIPVVTVAAFAGTRSLHPCPFFRGKFHALRFKLLLRVDKPSQVSPYL